MNLGSQNQFDDDFKDKKLTARCDPPEGAELSFYLPYLREVQQSAQPKLVLDWNVFDSFKLEMDEIPEAMLKDWILGVRPEFKMILTRSQKLGYRAQDGTSIYWMLFNELYYWSLIYWKEFSISFRSRLEVNFGVQDPEDEDEEDEEEKTSTNLDNFPETAPKKNVVLCFGDLDSPSKSIFTDLHSGFVMKLMDKNCSFDTQVGILTAYLQILSQAENKHNVYYGVLIDFDSRTFFKYNRDESTLFQSKTFEMNLEELYIKQNWNEDESQFYQLLGAICLKLLKDSAKISDFFQDKDE